MNAGRAYEGAEAMSITIVMRAAPDGHLYPVAGFPTGTSAQSYIDAVVLFTGAPESDFETREIPFNSREPS